jgi:hypothetical protein
MTAPSRPKEAPMGRPATKSREAPNASSPVTDKEKQLRGRAANKPDVNKDVKDEWQLPKEKTYRDLFHPIKCRENTRDWPSTVAHHD